MANVRDSDISLWLTNKLGNGNDSWTTGSICSQLNKEVLRNIKDCFSDLQTQVKLKLLLSFFHIPRRLVEEWKSELEEIIEVAGIDSELWVSMIAETIKTFPATGSLNTEITDYEETRPIFTEMVNDLGKLVHKHSDVGMLPLECQYLNKAAFISVVGNQPTPIKHFVLKRKPKSTILRAELLQKSSDAQCSLKKQSAPIIPLRSRGMPRKMTDTTPLKGIPSRVLSSGFRSPTSTSTQNRPNLSRSSAGRKDGGIKLLEITEQPLGYAAAKKRKRQQELEEQQRRSIEAHNNSSNVSSPLTPVTTTPDYAAGLNATSVYTQPAVSVSSNTFVKEATTASIISSQVKTDLSSIELSASTVSNTSEIIENEQEIELDKTTDKEDISVVFKKSKSNLNTSIVKTMPVTKLTNTNHTASTKLSSNVSKKVVRLTNIDKVIASVATEVVSSTVSTSVPALTSTTTLNTINKPPGLIIRTIEGPTVPIRTSAIQTMNTQIPSGQKKFINVVTSGSGCHTVLKQVPTLTAISGPSNQIGTQLRTVVQQSPQNNVQTKIVQIKTAPTIQPIVVSSAGRTIQSIPPLISTQQPTILNIQNLQTIAGLSKTSATSGTVPQLIATSISQSQQQTGSVQITTSNSNAPKFTQMIMPTNNKTGKTIILPNPNVNLTNVQPTKGIFIRSVGPDGNPIFQPISNMSGLTNIGGTTILATAPQNTIIKSTGQSIQQNQQQIINNQQIPALVPTSQFSGLTPVVIASHGQNQTTNIPSLIASNAINRNNQSTTIQMQPQPQGQTIIRPVYVTNTNNHTVIPQGFTLIQTNQRSQLVQTLQQPQQMQRTILTQPGGQQINQLQIRAQQPQLIQIQPNQQSQQHTIVQQQASRGRGLTLSTEHIGKAHEMFRQANRVSRPEKALILGFMSGCRENPRPTPENVIVIKLGETEEKVKQVDDTYALMRVESLIKLDYNTGEWTTFKNHRRIDQGVVNQQLTSSQNEQKLNQTQNSVVI